jgi:hypothetical protein
MVSSNGRMRLRFRSALLGIALLLMVTVAGVGNAMAATTHYIAANGSDSNDGTSKTTPWLHAPGMPNCAATCAAFSIQAGDAIIFRGGDTWHFGNSGLAPYTGGTLDLYGLPNWGNNATCTFGASVAGCIYYGVDLNWFSGGSWVRPIFTGDNPATTSLISGSCPHQVPNTASYVSNAMISMAPNSIIDNFELTGMCSQNGSPTSQSTDIYVANLNTGVYGLGMGIVENVYVHGWSATTTAGTVGHNWAGTIFGGGTNGLQSFDHIVVDGSDSSPGAFAWATFPSFYTLKDSMIRYTGQGVGQFCHNIHDNIFEHFYNHNGTAGSHSNVLECNDDNPGNAPNQPQNTPNVFYNNIVRHDDASYVGSGQVHLWFCPETVPEYWFNNIMYDVAFGNDWDYAGPPIYGCSGTGGQFMFNNTLVDVEQPCHVSNVNHGGQYLTVLNEHLINTPFDGGSTTACTGLADATNKAMTDATATSQGYTTGTAGTSRANTCTNDSTMPCTSTSAGNSTVGTGGNHQAYCTTLASFSSEPAIGTDAANACKFGTTDGCAYNTSTHTMNCPAHTAVARPVSTAWDVGAYEFAAGGGGGGSPPAPPTNLTGVVH